MADGPGRPGGEAEGLDAAVERRPEGPYVGVHRARPPALRRWAPVALVLVAAVLAVVVVRVWFAVGG